MKIKYESLRSKGVTGVFLSGVDEREFAAVKEAGLDLHAWIWTTNRWDPWIRENHPDWYMVSRSGKSCFDNPPYVDYYRWISPVIPGFRRYIEDVTGQLAAHPAVDGVHLDYVRYPDVILPRALWDQYGLNQTEELPDYDFCYGEHTRNAFREQYGRDPLEILDPCHDPEWLQFRYDSVTALVKEIHHMVKSHKKQLTAAVFPTPALARKICRQDWSSWPLDAACPMLYHNFYQEGIEWIGNCVREDVEQATFPIIAGLYLPALQKADAMQSAARLASSGGASGISLFGEPTAEQWHALAECCSA